MTTVPSLVSQQLGLLSSGADPADVRDGQSFIKPGSLAIQAGSMPDNGDLGTIIPGTENIDIPLGYTSGGVVQGDENLLPSNVKAGVDLFGVVGTAVLAEGNAQPEQVLDGITYSTGAGAGVGIMANNGDLGTIIPGTTSQPIPEGFTTGGMVAGSTNLTATNIRNGTQVFDVMGTLIPATGSATADKLLLGQTASNTSGPITGTMPNNGSLGTITPTTTDQSIPLGYTSGGTVAGSANLLPGNVRLGVNMFGVTGTLDPGSQTGGTAVAADVLSGKTFTNDTGVQTGTMVNRGAVTITPSGSSQTIQQGYHNGSGTVAAVTFDATKVLTGTTIAGTAGTMPNNGAIGTITPGTSDQTISAGYTTGGTVAGDADLVAANIKNGVNIFGVVGTLSDGVPYATGNATSGTTQSSYTLTDNSTAQYYSIIVTGLTFLPRVITLTTSTGTVFGFYSEKTSAGSAGKYFSIGPTKITGNASVTATGFRLPSLVASVTYTWEAFG